MLSKSPTGSGGEPSSPTRILTGRGSSAPFFLRRHRETIGSSLRASPKSAAAVASGCTAEGTSARLRRPRLFDDASQIRRRSFPDAVSFIFCQQDACRPALRISPKSAAAAASGCTAEGTPARFRRPCLFGDASQIHRRSFPDAVSFLYSRYRRKDLLLAYLAKVRGRRAGVMGPMGLMGPILYVLFVPTIPFIASSAASLPLFAPHI